MCEGEAFSHCFPPPETTLAVACYYFTSNTQTSRNCSNPLFLFALIYLSVRSQALRSPSWKKQCHQYSKENRTHRKVNIRPACTLFGVQCKANLVLLVPASLTMYYRPFALTELSNEARICTIRFSERNANINNCFDFKQLYSFK